jgi:hypothetical protein
MLHNLFAPPIDDERANVTGSHPETYHRLGKNLPGSGNFVRYSLSAETLNANAEIPKITAPMMAVLVFQFAG